MATGSPIGLLLSLTYNDGGVTTLFINKSDTLTLSENIQISGVPNPNVSDTLTTIESIMILIGEGIAVLDTVVTSENVQIVLSDPQLAVSDSLTLSESQSVSIATFADLSLTVSDNLTLSEFISIDVTAPTPVPVTGGYVPKPQVQPSDLDIEVNDGLELTEYSAIVYSQITKLIFLTDGRAIAVIGKHLFLDESLVIQVGKLLILPDGFAWKIREQIYYVL